MVLFALYGFWSRNVAGGKRLSRFSFVMLGIVFVSGGLAAYCVANAHSLAGLFERGAIFGFIVWLAVFSVAFLRRDRVS
jgi:hypothetical protein